MKRSPFDWLFARIEAALVAAAFAEEGDHETARAVLEEPVEDTPAPERTADSSPRLPRRSAGF